MNRIYCQILGTGADGSSPCLVAVVERLPLYGIRSELEAKCLSKYLFNAGEGVARFAGEYKVKLAKNLEKVFFCGTSPNDWAGYPAVILNLSAIGAPSLQVFGPAGTDSIVNATQKLLYRPHPQVSVTPLELDDNETAASFELDDKYLDIRAGIVATCINKSSKKRARVDVPKWTRPLALYRCQVKQPNGQSFIVLSCPCIEHASILAQHSLVQQGATYIFHFTCESVASHPQYAPLLSPQLGQHILVNSAGNVQILHRAVAERTIKLHVASPTNFPIHSALCGDIPASERTETSSHVQGEPLMKVVLMPAHECGIHVDCVPESIDIERIRTESEGKVLAAKKNWDTQEQDISKIENSQDSANVLERECIHEQKDVPQVHDNADAYASNGSMNMQESISIQEVEVEGEVENFEKLPTTNYSAAALLRMRLKGKNSNMHSIRTLPSDTEKNNGIHNIHNMHGTHHNTHNMHTINNTHNMHDTHSTLPACVPPEQATEPEEDTSATSTSTSTSASSIIFLGTGSAAPSKCRGCSGILLKVDNGTHVVRNITEKSRVDNNSTYKNSTDIHSSKFEGNHTHSNVRNGTDSNSSTYKSSKGMSSSSICVEEKHKHFSILMDAGEGTFGHLCRQFGYKNALTELHNLGCMWISHKHADHMTGALRILYLRATLPNANPNANPNVELTPLVVIAPTTVLQWLDECSKVAPYACKFTPICIERCACWRPPAHVHTCVRELMSVPVDHCHGAYGLVISIQGKDKINKIVYSGDTRPCPALERAGAGASLLIHEATFDDTMAANAVAKKHCTTKEALKVAANMRARSVILTHFSQRYPSLPPTMNEGQKAATAYDGMVVHTNVQGCADWNWSWEKVGIYAAAVLKGEPKEDLNVPDLT